MQVIGLDIGGANIKAADVDGRAVARGFEIWKTPDRLAAVLTDVLAEFQPFDVLAVTMTAELADCFSTKAQGVDFILGAVETAAESSPVFVWQTGAEFVSPDVAREIPLLVAAANWHCLATWLGRMVPESTALLLDIGTTTTDVIPLRDGVPIPRGLTDRERLESGELVYSGVRRTPLCAISDTVPFRGGQCPLAAELFATTLDVYLILGQIPEDPDDCNTANGKPATRSAAHDRLARSLCCDRTEFTFEDAEQMAAFCADVQKRRIQTAIDSVLAELHGECRTVLASGSGEFLVEQIVGEHPVLRSAELISLSTALNVSGSEAACALAVAHLASEGC